MNATEKVEYWEAVSSVVKILKEQFGETGFSKKSEVEMMAKIYADAFKEVANDFE
tara:strand:- start:783 stop:947 length:165 start_codon:yes stop_codon:yes gene_type:complete